jgi:hypothetical protein
VYVSWCPWAIQNLLITSTMGLGFGSAKRLGTPSQRKFHAAGSGGTFPLPECVSALCVIAKAYDADLGAKQSSKVITTHERSTVVVCVASVMQKAPWDCLGAFYDRIARYTIAHSRRQGSMAQALHRPLLQWVSRGCLGLLISSDSLSRSLI